MKDVRIIIFDLDGTLVNAYAAVARSLNYSLNQFGYPKIDDDVIRRRVGWGETHLVRQFVSEEHLKGILKIYRKDHKVTLKTGTKFLPGARELLKELKRRKYKLAIASNRATVYTRIILKHLNVLDYFQIVLCADKVKRPKPAPDLLKVILKKTGLKSSQALYVGDMTIDVQTGHKAKVKTVAVVTGSSTRQEIQLLEPFRIIRRVDHVLDILDESILKRQ